MAIVRKLEYQPLETVQDHSETVATYSLVKHEGETYLQIDTYGSPERSIPGKKSQSIRLSKSALEQLRRIIDSM